MTGVRTKILMENRHSSVTVQEGTGDVTIRFRGNPLFTATIKADRNKTSQIKLDGPFQSDSKGVLVEKDDGLKVFIFLQQDIPFVFFLPIIVNKSPGKGRTVNRVSCFDLHLSLNDTAAGDSSGFNMLGVDGLDDVFGPARTSYLFQAIARHSGKDGIVYGWLSQERGSGIVSRNKNDDGGLRIEAILEFGRLYLEGGDLTRGEYFVIGGFVDALEGLEEYADLIKNYYDIKLPPIPTGGYCTWYSMPFGGSGTEESIAEIAEFCGDKLADLGFQVIQIDDGWQAGPTRTGDVSGPRADFTTHDPNGPFPSGMAHIASVIKDHGLVPGIWLLPFAWDPRSDTLKDHQDWFARNRGTGEIYRVQWAGWCLDMSHPGASGFLKECIDRITREWGFRYLKLDGLWAGMACQQNYPHAEYRHDGLGDAIFHDERKTNVEVFRMGLKHVREAAATGTYILGCNVAQNFRTLGAAMGLVDAMRIGRDVAARWDAIIPCAEMGSRLYFLHDRVWHNDPDCLVLREPLTLDEARTWASWIAISGQLNIVSEHLPWLQDEDGDEDAPEGDGISLLEIYKATIPNAGTCGRPIDLFQKNLPSTWVVTRGTSKGENPRVIIGLFNWDDRDATIKIEPARVGIAGSPLIVYEFWSGRAFLVTGNVLEARLAPHACAVFSARVAGDEPTVISTSRHVLQGIPDIIDETWNEPVLRGTSRVARGNEYELRVYPGKWQFKEARVASSNNPDDQVVKPRVLVHDNQGSAPIIRVAFTPPTSEVMAWEIEFEKPRE